MMVSGRLSRDESAGGIPDDPESYRRWVKHYNQLDVDLVAVLPFLRAGRVSIVMAAGDTSVESAIRTAENLRAQIYTDWELVIGLTILAEWPRDEIHLLSQAEPRVRLLDKAAGKSRFETALQSCDGAFICIMEPGDTLEPTALYELVDAFLRDDNLQCMYSDEDIGGRRAPRFKPDFSPELLAAGNCLGQLAMYRAGLVSRIGLLTEAGTPYVSYEIACRAGRLLMPSEIGHLPAILYHRDSEAADWPVPAEQASRHFDAAPPSSNIWPRRRLPLPSVLPLVSIIVPVRDKPELLQNCLNGLLYRTDYSRFEILIVDNGSTDPVILTLLDERGLQPNIRVLSFPGDFNFAAINNFAARQAQGDILLLLNNDVEILQPDWLQEMVSHAVRPEVGIVGARLLYLDGSIQHAGILLGPDAAATHVGRGAARDASGYDGQLALTRELSAVTGACLAIRSDVFKAVGGMEERLAVAWNDVDLCLRVRAKGLRIIWTPHAVLRHHEAQSRGLDAENIARQELFRAEQALMRDIWGQAMERDPFLNPNLMASEAGPLLLAPPRARRVWQ